MDVVLGAGGGTEGLVEERRRVDQEATNLPDGPPREGRANLTAPRKVT